MDESSPGRILLRLEELRRWQKLQEERLYQEQLLQRKQLTDQQYKLCKKFDISQYDLSNTTVDGSSSFHDKSLPSEEDSKLAKSLSGLSNVIEGVSVLAVSRDNVPLSKAQPPVYSRSTIEHTDKCLNFDELPVLSAVKDFETLLEDKIKNNDAGIIFSKIEKEKKNMIKPMKFLRKGRGMARFNMTPDDIGLKASTKRVRPDPPPACSPSPILCVPPVELEVSPMKLAGLNSGSEDHVARDLRSRIEFDGYITPPKNTKTWGSLLTEEQEHYGGLLSQNSGCSDTSVASTGTLKSRKELDEQRIFELLERKVANSSFSSNSSFIGRLIAARGCSDTPTANRNFVHSFPHVLNLKPDLTDIETIENLNSSRESEAVGGHQSRPGTDEETTGDDEYSESTDTEQTCRVSLNGSMSTSTPNQNQKGHLDKDSSNCSPPTNGNVIKIMICQEDADSFKVVKDLDDSSAIHSLDENRTLLHHDSDKADTAHLNYDILERVNLSSKVELLKTRLKELESEINIFKVENELVSKMRKELESERELFLAEKAKAERKLNEDKVVSEYYLAEEKEKLTKQKRLYDRHVKDMKGNSIKKEKEDTIFLKNELSNLREQTKAREAKTGAAQASLRTRLKTLERENADLKTANDKLRKENIRIRNANMRSRRLSNIQKLAEINKSLAQFSIEKELEDENRNLKLRNTDSKTKKPKSNVVEHRTLLQRSKSVPNFRMTSHYAKYFSQRDEEWKRNTEEQLGYGLLSDSDDASLSCDRLSPKYYPPTSILPEVKGLKPELNTTNFKNDSKKKKENLKSSISEDLVEKMYTEKFNADNETISSEETVPGSGSVDHTVVERPDGSKEIKFSNGNIKVVSPDQSYSKFTYYNGDVKETFYREGTIKYYYRDSDTHHTTYRDGSQLLLFPDGQLERRHADGAVESRLADGRTGWAQAGGASEWRFPDGTLLRVAPGGDRTLRFPNGQVEVHTADHKRREYPDGTVKVVYSDGAVETRYASGRVRVRNAEGHLLLDSGGRDK